MLLRRRPSRTSLEVKKIDAAEEELLEQLRRGSEEALREIISRYSGYVGSIVWGIIGSSMTPADAEETVADAFYTLWKNSGRVRDGCLRAYLASIARSRAKNKLREAKLDICLEDDMLELPDRAPAATPRWLPASLLRR